MLLFFALVCFATSSDAAVTFSSAIIYDEYDLKGVPEIRLDKCSVGGCSIYVSAPKWSVEATRNIYVYSKSAGTNVSLYNIATEVDVTTYAKTGLHLSNTDYSLMNYNKDAVGNILIYVVGGETQFYGSDQVEIYDAVNINMRPSKNKKMTMIMSAAEPYNLYVQAYEGNLNAFVRATGFDNNYARDSKDECRIIYDHNEGKPFRVRMNSPVATINFDGQKNYQICATIDQANTALLDYPGMTTSQGYVGCSSNLFAYFRSSYYTNPVFELHDDHNSDRDTDLTYAVNSKQSDKLSFTTYYTGGSKPFNATGDGKTAFTRTEKASKINAVFANQYGSSYWLGYTPKTGAVQIPSGQGVCTDWSKTTTGVPQTTSTAPTTTTSGANELYTVFSSAIALFVAWNL